jgi:hypothetical protein
MRSDEHTYQLDNPRHRIDWLRDMHALALGVADLGENGDRAARRAAIDRAYADATAPLAKPIDLVLGIVRKYAGVDVGARYTIGDVEYRSADQVIAVLGNLCQGAIDALRSAARAGDELSSALDASGLVDDGDAEAVALDDRMRGALVECLVRLSEYERLTRREEDDNA